MKSIANRVLYIVDEKSKKCNIEIFSPVTKPDGFYYCKIKIENAPEGLDSMEISGTDSMQALLLAVGCLDAMVTTFNERYMNSKLRWEDDTILDLGFSVSSD